MGVPANKLRFIYVRARVGGPASSSQVAHMVLGYYATPNAVPLVLDSLISTILPATQRRDLTPVFSFNADGVYVDGKPAAPAYAPDRRNQDYVHTSTATAQRYPCDRRHPAWHLGAQRQLGTRIPVGPIAGAEHRCRRIAGAVLVATRQQ
ncbi:hypothetical protein G6F55_014061 [Rhizopus delemar]|nr:hypothetical protein G6F55_014061 [Rhizopus delemar]